MSEKEELQEALLDLERARARESNLRTEAEALVAGLAVLTRPDGASGRIQDLLDVLRRVFTFDDAVVLLLDEDGVLRTAASTSPVLAQLSVTPRVLFTRVLEGQPVAIFDIGRIEEWQAMPDGATGHTMSALHIPVRAGPRVGMLVCTHHEKGFFKSAQTDLARRFAPLAGEILARADLERTAQQRDRFFTLTLDMMCIMDAGHVLKQLSRGWEQLGYEGRGLLGRSLLELVHPDDRLRTADRLVAAQRPQGGTFESRMIARDGVARWLLWNVSMPADDGLVYAAARDISDLKETQRILEERTQQLDVLASRLQDSAFSDALTGLRNRRYFQHRIDEDVAAVRRAHAGPPGVEGRNSGIGVVVLDLDRFKAINDGYGHASGDAVLAQVADRLRASIREVDTAIRWGGEEFLILLRQVDLGYVGIVAERIRAAVDVAPFWLPDGRAVAVTCSVGYSRFPLGAFGVLPFEDVLRVADAALYVAKHEGRNRVVGIDEGERGVTEEVVAMVRTDLRLALDRGHLRHVRTVGPPGTTNAP